MLEIVSFHYFASRPDGPYWGEHSFGQQRFYNIICLLYGRNPQQNAYITQKVDLGGRKDRCESDYQQKLSSWERLLAPYSIYDSKNPPASDGTTW